MLYRYNYHRNVMKWLPYCSHFTDGKETGLRKDTILRDVVTTTPLFLAKRLGGSWLRECLLPEDANISKSTSAYKAPCWRVSQERWEFRADSGSHQAEPGICKLQRQKQVGMLDEMEVSRLTPGAVFMPLMSILVCPDGSGVGGTIRDLGPICFNTKLSTGAKKMRPSSSWIIASWNCYRRLPALPTPPPSCYCPQEPSGACQSTFPFPSPGGSEVNKAISSCPLWWASPDLWPLTYGFGHLERGYFI